jgi:hypothetical protein
MTTWRAKSGGKFWRAWRKFSRALLIFSRALLIFSRFFHRLRASIAIFKLNPYSMINGYKPKWGYYYSHWGIFLRN